MWSDKAKSSGGATVEGRLTDYEFLQYFPFGEDTEPGDSIYLKIDITPDGADEPVSKAFYLGSSKFLAVTGKGKTLSACERDEDGTAEIDKEGTPKLYDKGAVYTFIVALESQLSELQFDMEAALPDPSEAHVIDFRPLLGLRLRLREEVDRERQIKAGRKALGSKGAKATEDEAFAAGKRKVKDGAHKGKEFNLTSTVLDKVLGIPGESAGKAAKKKATTPVEDEDADDGNDDADDDAPAMKPKEADKVLAAILAKEKGQKSKRDDLKVLVVRYCGKNKLEASTRSALLALFMDDAYFQGAEKRGVIADYKPGKNPVVALAGEADGDDDE